MPERSSVDRQSRKEIFFKSMYQVGKSRLWSSSSSKGTSVCIISRVHDADHDLLQKHLVLNVNLSTSLSSGRNHCSCRHLFSSQHLSMSPTQQPFLFPPSRKNPLSEPLFFVLFSSPFLPCFFRWISRVLFAWVFLFLRAKSCHFVACALLGQHYLSLSAVWFQGSVSVQRTESDLCKWLFFPSEST